MPEANSAGHRPDRPGWYQDLAKFEKPNYRHAGRQLTNTVLPLLGFLALMLYTVQHGYPYWTTLLLSLGGVAMFIRSFIFLHDCTHGSFFPSPRANAILGFCVGVFTLTPYAQWRWSHLTHHATFANLDRRSVGDIKLMTVEEFQAASRREQLIYRFYRHPLLLFGIGSTVLFGVIYRFPVRGVPPRDRNSVWWTDGAFLAVLAIAGLTIGIRPFLLVMTPIWVISWAIGVWLFYVQHQFPGVYWARQSEWDFFRAALEGSSYYRLPKVLQWITGSIGIHHLHHLRPRIPNYYLQQAYDATPAVQAVRPLILRRSLGTLRLNLYDEDRKQLISFHDLQHGGYGIG